MSSDPAIRPPLGPSAFVTGDVSVPIEQAWKRFVAIELPKVFPKAKGPIPPVLAVHGQDGPWDEPGRSRTVALGDGSSVHEAITLSEPSRGAAPSNGRARFGYTVSGFTGPMGRLAREAHGFWLFTEGDGKTRIEWTYAFMPTGALARPILAIIIATFWHAYMRDGMANVVTELQRSDSP